MQRLGKLPPTQLHSPHCWVLLLHATDTIMERCKTSPLHAARSLSGLYLSPFQVEIPQQTWQASLMLYSTENRNDKLRRLPSGQSPCWTNRRSGVQVLRTHISCRRQRSPGILALLSEMGSGHRRTPGNVGSFSQIYATSQQEETPAS